MLLVTGDWHLSSNPRDGYRHAWVERFIALAQAKQPKAIIILGDLTEEKDRHTAGLVNDIVAFIAELAQICPVVGLQGNHDYVADPSYGFWPFLSCIKNIEWLIKPEANVFGIGNLLYLPHTRNYKQDWAAVRFDGYDWIFAHNTFEGASTEHGHKLSGIPRSVFPGDARVISGDIHTPQQLPLDNGGYVVYVGAPYLCDFGDDYKPRILELHENGRYKSIPCPGAQKRLVTISGPEELQLQTHVKPGDILKVRVSLSMKERERWPEVQAEVRKWAETMDCILYAVQPKFQVTNAGRARLEPGQRRSDEDTLKQYAAARKVNPATLETGLTFLEA